jgi:hypothetical protein
LGVLAASGFGGKRVVACLDQRRRLGGTVPMQSRRPRITGDGGTSKTGQRDFFFWAADKKKRKTHVQTKEKNLIKNHQISSTNHQISPRNKLMIFTGNSAIYRVSRKNHQNSSNHFSSKFIKSVLL